jgi:hypothetical protein
MQDQELNKAFLKAIKTYFNDNEIVKPMKTDEGRKYNKKYFDGVQREVAPDSKFYGKQDEPKDDKKTKKKSGYVNTVYKVKK